MPGSFEAVAVILTAIIPGATYVWAVERWVGRWGEGLSDRVLRFTGASAVVHFLLAPFTYAVWRDYFVDGPRLGVGHPFPWPAWLYLGLYLALPAGAGALVGFGQREGWTSIKALAGVKAPKAWDHLFGSRPAGWIKLKLKSGAWVGGWYGQALGTESYASGHPQAGDLYLAQTIEVDQATGDFIVDAQRRPARFGPGILVRWDEVEYLKFQEVTS